MAHLTQDDEDDDDNDLAFYLSFNINLFKSYIKMLKG